MKESYPPVEGIVGIAHDIHVKTDEVLQNLFTFLSEDYDIKDCSKEQYHPHQGYFACLKDTVLQHMTKCDYCQHLNSNLGCKCHGYRCKNCNQILWFEYMKGGTVRFSFRNDSRSQYVTLFIHSYDEASESLFCYPKYVKNNSWFSIKKENFPLIMEEFKDAYEVVIIDGKKLYKFFYPAKGKLTENVQINMAETRRNGDHCHYQSISLFKGKEYKDSVFGENFPARKTYMIYLTKPLVHDKNMSSKIIHMAGQVSDCGYYYQDGSQAFYETQLRWMSSIIEHFTELDLNKFKKFIKICRLDGPGFIIHLADWIEKQTGVKQYVENKPNIGNLIHGFSKVLSGQYLTDDEKIAMKKAANDRPIMNQFTGLMMPNPWC